MMWLVIAALGFAGWLSVVLLFLALCRAAARADALQNRPLREDRELALVTAVTRRLGRDPGSLVLVTPEQPRGEYGVRLRA
jgi:hypothetical protein